MTKKQRSFNLSIFLWSKFSLINQKQYHDWNLNLTVTKINVPTKSLKKSGFSVLKTKQKKEKKQKPFCRDLHLHHAWCHCWRCWCKICVADLLSQQIHACATLKSCFWVLCPQCERRHIKQEQISHYKACCHNWQEQAKAFLHWLTVYHLMPAHWVNWDQTDTFVAKKKKKNSIRGP